MTMTSKRKNPHAVALGRKGGKVTSPAKRAAVRANGAKGGTKVELVQGVHPEAELVELTPQGWWYKAGTPAAWQWLKRHSTARRGERGAVLWLAPKMTGGK